MPLVEDRHEWLGIDLRNVADIAEVRASRLGSRTHEERRSILPGEPDRSRAQGVNAGDDVRPDLAREHHLRDLHRRRVGHAEPVHELRLDAHPLLPRADLRPSTMDDDRSHADEAQEHDVLEQRIEVGGGARRAADLDHQDVAGETLDVGECLDEHLGAVNPFVDGLFRHGGVVVAPYQVV